MPDKSRLKAESHGRQHRFFNLPSLNRGVKGLFRYITMPFRLPGLLKQLKNTVQQQQDSLQVQSARVAQLEGALAQIKRSTSCEGTELPFYHEADEVDWLQRSEARVGVPLSTLDSNQRDSAFYSYYSEMGGDQLATLEAHYAVYLPLIRKAPEGVVLDIGCGAGEFLRYLSAQGFEAEGVDMDSGEVARAREQGLSVNCADAQAFLDSAVNAYAAITLLQVIEHLPWEQIRTLLKAAYSRIAPGGCLILETINLRHPLALNGFYTDPTHRLPLSDNLLTFLMQWAGFESVRLVYMLPYPVAGIGLDDPSRLYHNYAVIGYRPQVGS